MHGAQMLMDKPVVALTAAKITRELRKIELGEGSRKATGASGATLVRFRAGHWKSPVVRLIEEGAIGPAERDAAGDFVTAFDSMSGPRALRAQNWERVDRSYDSVESIAVMDAQRRYGAFAKHWSMRRGWGDKTLEIMIETVWEERPFGDVDTALGLAHGKAKLSTVRGLRDYAARMGLVSKRKEAEWKAEAGCTFRRPKNWVLQR